MSVIILLSLNLISSYAKGDGQLTVIKAVNIKEIFSTDLVQVKLEIRNNGFTPVHNVTVVDNIPSIFNLYPTKLSEGKGALNFVISNMNGQFKKYFTYFLKLKNNVNTTTDIFLPPAEVTYSTSEGIFLATSEQPELKIKPIIMEELSISPIVFLVLAVTFTAGFIGAGIHWANMKQEQRNEVGASNFWKHALFGGAAGVIVFATSEALSALFSDHIIKLTSYTIAFLVGASLTAGFAPQLIVANATAKVQQQKKNVEEDRDNAKIRAKGAGSGLKAREKELDQTKEKMKKSQDIIKTLTDMVSSLQHFVDTEKAKQTRK
jgi:hypothetical protein